MKSNKTMGGSAKVSLLGAICGLITLVAFIIYGVMYDYFDTVVCLTFALGAACAAGYALLSGKASELLNLVSVILVTFGVGLFFLNSYPVWADRLNNISMYGSRGTLFPVILIIVLSFITIFLEIVSCFIRKEVRRA